MNFKPLTGLVAAPFTPFHPDGSVDYRVIARQAASLAANGVTGAFICGTTGEGLSLTTAERMGVAEEWMKVAPDSLRVVVHTGHAGLADSRTLATHAEKIGAAGVGCFAPCFFKPAAIPDLVRFCQSVASAAPDLPFYYYHIPSMTGVNFAMADFLRAAGETIPNLAGIKFTYENLMDFGLCLELENRRFDMVFGRDEMLLAGLGIGAKGAIGSTYNFAAPVYQRIIAAFEKGDLVTARAEQARANAMIEIFVRHGGLPAGKAIMQLIGLDCGPTRIPLRTLSTDQLAQLRRELEAVGFFDYCQRPA